MKSELIPFSTSKLFDKNFVTPEGCDLTVNRGGTSSGKTYTILQVLIMKAHTNKGSIITVVGQDIPNLKKGAIRDLFSILATSEIVQSLVKYYNRTDRILYFKNGSIIEFNSYDDEQDAKNGKRDYAFFNEVNGISYPVFEAIYVRTRVHTWVDFNPSSEFWLSEMKMEERQNVRTFKSTYEHNPFLDKSIIDKILSYEPTKENIENGTADEYRWRVYGKGEYAPLEGAIFNRWKRGTFDDTLPYIHGIDWGVRDPFTLTKVAVNDKKKIIYLKQIAYASELSMTNIKSIVNNHCTKEDIIVCDSAEPLNIRELRDLDFNAIACYKKSGIVAQRISWIKDYLLVVDDSPDIERELKNYVWAEKKSQTPIDNFNHSIDGFSYAFVYWWFNVKQR